MMFALSSRAARVAAALCCAAFALAFAPRPASADDVLHVVGGSTPTSFYEVIEDVAQFGGLYKAENLNVDKQYAGSASVCIQLVASGKGDICTASIEPIILGWEKGVRLVSFFSRDPRYDYLLAVLDSSPIKTLADFKGKDIGEINLGSTSEISANHMLAGAGVAPGSVAYIPIGVGPQAISAITSGKIAALSFPSVELGTYSVVAGLKFRYYRDPILDSIPNVAFNALPATLQTKADLLKRFTRAMVKAAIVIRVNPAFAAKCFLQGAGQKLTPEALANETKELEITQGDLPASDLSNPRIGYMPVAGVQLYTRFMNDQGLTKTVVPAASIVSNEFIAQANEFDRKAFIAQAKAMK
jgi:NitT/TauT family transport system substrate-binding protein